MVRSQDTVTDMTISSPSERTSQRSSVCIEASVVEFQTGWGFCAGRRENARVKEIALYSHTIYLFIYLSYCVEPEGLWHRKQEEVTQTK